MKKKGNTVQTVTAESAVSTSEYLRQAADQLEQIERQRAEILSSLAQKGIAVPNALPASGKGNKSGQTRTLTPKALAAIRKGQRARREKEAAAKATAEAAKGTTPAPVATPATTATPAATELPKAA